MMQKMLVQDAKEEEPLESEKLVSEVLEIMGMVKKVEKKIHDTKSSQNSNFSEDSVGKMESLLQTLGLEMTKRLILLANKYGIRFKPSVAPVLLNGGSSEKPREKSFIVDDFSSLEEELNKAYRVARETLNNLSRLV
ncbi:MAG: hypothetical protein QXF52_07245 [Thermoproteota archaeon]